MKAMILAAGLGSRMEKLTKDIPKPLLEVGGSSLIEKSIKTLMNEGIDTIVLEKHTKSHVLSRIRAGVLELSLIHI